MDTPQEKSEKEEGQYLPTSGTVSVSAIFEQASGIPSKDSENEDTRYYKSKKVRIERIIIKSS